MPEKSQNPRSSRSPLPWAQALCVLSASFILLLPTAAGSGQFATPLSQFPGAPGPRGSDDPMNGDPALEDRMLKALNADRQRSMVSDTDKLVRLVNALNAQIARTSPDALSPAQLRQMAEIEKLARSVKEKMRLSVRGTAPYRLPEFPRR